VKVCGSWMRGGDQGKYSPDPISFHILKTYHHTFLDPFIEWINEYKEKLDKMILLEDIHDRERIDECKQVFSRFWPESWRDDYFACPVFFFLVRQRFPISQ
jgi:hypothetical protein